MKFEYDDKKAVQFVEAAGSWLSQNKTARIMFADAKQVARLAVAEYLANKDGYTIYAHLAEV